MGRSELKKFVNCRILRDHKIVWEDIWVRDGKIINPEKVFFDEQIQPNSIYDCKGNIIAPGFIDLQINGGFGYDFSHYPDTEKCVSIVSKKLLSHGVTSFCPTLVTSPKEIYQVVLPKIPKKNGGKHGASVLGVHTEGPFINAEKKGAHPPRCIQNYSQSGIGDLEKMYGSLENIKIVTLAPEFERSDEVIRQLTKKGIVVSLGHSMSDLSQGEKAVHSGASFITHLFNAMLPFHHRDPGLVGLLTSDQIPKNKTIYFGIISDGIHTHPAALRIAYRSHPNGLVLVTDAISALGLEEGKHNIGQLAIEIREGKAFIAGTDTLCGSIASMLESVRFFMGATGCSPEYALETATLHPALVLGIDGQKGTLNYDADADFIILTSEFQLQSTWIAGELVYEPCNCK